MALEGKLKVHLDQNIIKKSCSYLGIICNDEGVKESFHFV
jgi:hypothetical protein